MIIISYLFKKAFLVIVIQFGPRLCEEVSDSQGSYEKDKQCHQRVTLPDGAPSGPIWENLRGHGQISGNACS